MQSSLKRGAKGALKGSQPAKELEPCKLREATVVSAAERMSRPEEFQPLVPFLQSLGLDAIEIERERDTGRELSIVPGRCGQLSVISGRSKIPLDL